MDDPRAAHEGAPRAPGPAVRARAGDPRRGAEARTGRLPRVSGRALEILDEARRLGRGGSLVFPGARGRPLGRTAIWELLRMLEVGAVPHGFRFSFRDWVAEETDHPREVAEAALAHEVRNQVEAAYRRTDLFERRRVPMA